MTNRSLVDFFYIYRQQIISFSVFQIFSVSNVVSSSFGHNCDEARRNSIDSFGFFSVLKFKTIRY